MLVTAHGPIPIPAFLPDATVGVVRAMDAEDLRQAKVQALVMNVFHLMQRPGSSTIDALGGLHAMSGWRGPITTDSGGFQAYSLIRQNAKFGTLSDQGISFQPENSERKFQLTPEKSVQLQLSYGADIVVCLDDCTHPDDDDATQRLSVERTVAWAARCKREFETVVGRRRSDRPRPLLFGVVQGGASPELRRVCAERLLELGFDGYGYGGWPLKGDGSLLKEMLQLTRELIPREFPMHALGVGHPEHIVTCAGFGYELFDSALPTRDARGGRLYAWAADPSRGNIRLAGKFFSYVYVEDDKHIKAKGPISLGCDCHTCQNYALGYIHHLQQINETLFYRLATIHNLRFMTRLMEILQVQRSTKDA